MGNDLQPGRVHYLQGRGQAAWKTDIPCYRQVRYHDLYPGIDAVFYETGGQLEYDFIVAPGADPRRITLALDGAQRVKRTPTGNLRVSLSSAQMEFRRPTLYQPVDGRRVPVVGHYVLSGKGDVRFSVGPYDPGWPLVIDPLISTITSASARVESVVYADYVGSATAGITRPSSVAVDAQGDAYVTGSTMLLDFPTKNPFRSTNASGGYTAFVTKVDASGQWVYSTYLGGSLETIAQGIAVDSSGEAILTGYTQAVDFPTTNAIQSSSHGDGTTGFIDAFLTKLNAAGNALVYSTYLGGTQDDWANSIAVDGQGNAVTTGVTYSTDFPIANARQTSNTAASGTGFLTKVDPTGKLVYSSYFGGNTSEQIESIALDGTGNAYITGISRSANFPFTTGVLQTARHGPIDDMYVAKCSPTGALTYATYLSRVGLEGSQGIAVDGSGNAYVTGYTSAANFPTLNPFQATLKGTINTFVSELNPTASALVASTYLGGSLEDVPAGITVTRAGDIAITGTATSPDFPLLNSLYASHSPTGSAFVTAFNSTGNAAVYSMLFGGSGISTAQGLTHDGSDNILVAGGTMASDLPLFNSYANAPLGAAHGFLTKIATGNYPVPTISALNPASAAAGSPAFSLTVTGSHFVPDSVLTWNGSPRPTRVVSVTQLVAAITSADVASPGTANVAVRNPTPGGGSSATVAFKIGARGPTLNALSPASAVAGRGALTLTVNGSNFVSGATVQWNGASRTTTFVSATQLTASIPASDLAAAGTATVTVINPDQNTSNGLTFTINNPAPTLASVNPNSAIAGQAGFTLAVTGSGFNASSVVRWNGSARTTTFISATQLSAAITAADVAAAGSMPVTVFNPTPGGGTSSALTFQIVNPPPTLSTLSPASATAGTNGLTLTVLGAHFISGAIVEWNGSTRATTFQSGVQLTVDILASDLQTAGLATVKVLNPDHQLSNGLPFTINPGPSLASLSPTTATAGASGLTLTVNGAHFINGASVRWNGASHTTTFVSATQLTAAIPASDLAAAGTATVTVVNPDQTKSNGLTFTINNPAPTLTSISPTSATAGQAGFTLTVTGSGFNARSVVRWNGSARTTSYVSATQLTTAVTNTDVAIAGTLPVTVFNPTPGGGTSVVVNFTIRPAPIVLAWISPASATVGQADLTLQVHGTNFQAGAAVQWNGSPLATTFIDASDLSAVIPASFLNNAGTAMIGVMNPDHTASNTLSFTIGNPVPTLTSVSPASAYAGQANLLLTVLGTGFIPGSRLSWNGAPLSVISQSATQLDASVPSTLLQTAGTATLQVTNPTPGGGVSDTVSFVIGHLPRPDVQYVSPLAPDGKITITTSYPADTVFQWILTAAQGSSASMSSAKTSGSAPVARVSVTSHLLSLQELALAPGAYHFSVFASLGPDVVSDAAEGDFLIEDSTLADVRVYPNPWRADHAREARIRFDRLGSDATVKLFTLSGRWIKTQAAAQGFVDWDLTNDTGERVASGLYFYDISNAQGQKKTGKVAVIR